MRHDLPTVLVTGSGGFIGRHVVDALAGRAKVVHTSAGRARADLLDASARRALIRETRPEILFHLAWVTAHGQFWTSPANAAWEEASEDLFRLFFDAGGRRAVGTGSCAEYDWTTGAGFLREDAAIAPHTAYGAAKVRTMERLAAMADAAGAEWSWGRVFFLFGPGEPPGRLIPLMLSAARSHEQLGIGPADTVRDFWPVATMGAACAALALSPVTGPVNLASGTGTSFAELAAMVERLAGRTGLIIPGRRPLSPGEPVRLVADTTRLRHEVGFGDNPDLEGELGRYMAAMADHSET